MNDPTLDPPPALGHDELVGGWGDSRDPVCSVLVPTYQHEGFLGDALNSILAQRTSFPFEVIVRDDASTDGTAAVAEGFRVRYPEVVHVIAHEQRTYPRESPLRELQLAARGEFVAICEGDDYWTDAQKLQRQVDALRAAPHCSMAFHASIMLADREGVRTPEGPELDQDQLRDRSGDSVVLDAIPFRSLLYRNHPMTVVPEQYSGELWTEDTFLSVRLGLLGDALHVPGISPSVYRLHGTNLTSGIKQRPNLRMSRKVSAHLLIAEYLTAQGRTDLAEVYLDRALQQIASFVASQTSRSGTQVAVGALDRLPRPQRFSALLASLSPLRLRATMRTLRGGGSRGAGDR